ncbi:MAG: glycosyltransferase involved in cell wall biosynthesis [Ulvibacter sp.]|jgi:glycosyltransferase involved in cell wall biosynthesis
MFLLCVFAVVIFINCCYYLLFTKFSFLKNPTKKESLLYPISLIICAKNEAENLKTNIPLWLDQDYANFEVILINDASNDETLVVMENFAKEDHRIQIVNVENNEAFWGNKKYALTLGIKKAKNKRLLFTDADCRPASNLWLKKTTSNFSEQRQLILGYGAYNKTFGFLNALIRYETLLTAIQYFSYARAGLPYMGVGRNLAYTSGLFYDNNGFISHMKVPSGDDDLFVNEVATRTNTAICFEKEAFTYSDPKRTWGDWFLQKKRHISTAKYYKTKHKILLGSFYICNVIFWILAFLSISLLDWKIPAALIAFRFMFELLVIGKAALKLNERNLIPFIPLLEIFLVLAQMSIFISNSFSKPKRWK